MRVYYENSKGEILNLLSDKIAIQNIESLFDSKWDYSSATSMNFGGKVKKFYKALQERAFTLSIVCDTEDEFAALCKEIEDIIYYDVQVKKAGKLYVNDTYLSCFIFTSEYTNFEDLFYMTDKTYTLVTEYPNWVKEKVHVIRNSISLVNAVTGFAVIGHAKLSAGTDPEDDDSEETVRAYVKNELRVPCNFKIKINGEAVFPHLTVGDNIYNLDYDIPEGAYAVIDSKERTCLLYDGDEVINLFAYRNPDYSLFERIPPGLNQVVWNGSTELEFTLYEERGEPSWN